MDTLFTPEEAAGRLRLSPRTLERLRLTGDGPRFVKLGARRIAYRELDLQSWITGQVRTSTSDTGRAA